jgi:hypothetical protein
MPYFFPPMQTADGLTKPCTSNQRASGIHQCYSGTHGIHNELYLRSRTGVSASFLALTCAEGSESSSSRQTEGKLS